MLELFFYGGLAVIFLILFIVSIRENWDDAISGVFGIIWIVFISVFVVRLCIRPTEQDFCEIESKYNSLKRKVEVVKTLDYSERVVFYPDLTKEVEKMNNLIEKHKFNYNSKWDGYYYSSKIGQLEPINLW